MHICPVLMFTPEMDVLFETFAETHDVQVGVGWARWQRTTLPYGGGLNEQPAKLMDELAFVRQQQNALLRRKDAKPRRRDTTDDQADG
jgi:hypothetical protein